MPLTQIVSGVMPGTVAYFAAAANPDGFLECNGAAISRTAYAALFTAIGTAYGVGDGATTFNLPDLRGEFIRGHDNGRGVDSGRAIATAQAGQMPSHNHTVNTYVGGSGSAVANTGSDSGPYVVPGGTSATGGTSNSSENRPRNIAMRACIKF